MHNSDIKRRVGSNAQKFHTLEITNESCLPYVLTPN